MFGLGIGGAWAKGFGGADDGGGGSERYGDETKCVGGREPGAWVSNTVCMRVCARVCIIISREVENPTKASSLGLLRGNLAYCW